MTKSVTQKIMFDHNSLKGAQNRKKCGGIIDLKEIGVEHGVKKKLCLFHYKNFVYI